MDLRNLCSKIDVDAIRAKFPPLPDMMTQIKLPKSMSKLRSRKIFRSSRDNLNSETHRSSSKRSEISDNQMPMSSSPLPRSMPPADFVDYTPQRISTISSMVDQQGRGQNREGGKGRRRRNLEEEEGDAGFYRSAGGIEDYCPSPLKDSYDRRHSKPISPMRTTTMSPGRRTESEQNVKMSFVERVQKGYKDASEFRLKHIFLKKTVVRQDSIDVGHYVQGFKEDRRRAERDEEKTDRAIADNYDFNFQISRRKSDESFGISTPRESPAHQQTGINRKPLSEQSGDESGMEESPPKRKPPGIASTRFSRVRKVPLQMSLEDDDDEEVNQAESNEDEEFEFVDDEAPHPIDSALHKLHKRKEDEKENSQPQMRKSRSIKKRLDDLNKSTQQESKPSSSPKKRKAPLSPQQSEEDKGFSTTPDRPSADKQSEKPFGVIKQNLRRFQKSIKLPTSSSAAQSGAESDMDESNADGPKMKQSKTQQIAERLRRFRSVDNVDKPAEDENQENKNSLSPLHKFTNKLQEWKRRVKKNPSECPNTDDDEMKSPQKRDKPGGTLIRRLQHIRNRKQHSVEDPDDDEEGGATYKESFKSRAKLQLEKGVAAASQMPQMTMEKIKETKKYFRKRQEKEKEPQKKAAEISKIDSGESDLDDDDEDVVVEVKPHRKPKQIESRTTNAGGPAKPKHYYSSDDEEGDDDDLELQPAAKVILEPHQENVLVPLARSAWTAKPILSDSTGDDDDDDMLPRVLIHQDNSDIFESTIIIAVTRPVVRSHTSSPYITELPPDSPKDSAPDSPKASTPETKADSWVPNREIIAGFMEGTPPLQRKQSKDTTASTSSRGHSRKHSMDSSSEDSWIKDIPRGLSTAIGLNSLHETEEPWRAKSARPDEKLYKTNSIDIFDIHHKQGGNLEIFEDFDDELRNTPVVKIENKEEVHKATTNESFDFDDSSEELDNADDDNSSRITKILKQSEEVKIEEVKIEEIPTKDKLKPQLYGNSRESLMGNLDGPTDSGAEEDDEDSDSDDDNVDVDIDRPPSVAPSPPPSMSPPPPPLPQRQPSIRLSKLPKPPTPPEEELPSPPITLPPPLPKTKPPIPPSRPVCAPPIIPERTPSMSRVSKPLVKTASLRLAYSEQVNPKDVGKVNKLISHFEPNGRPRIIARKSYISQDSEDYSDQEEDEDDDSDLTGGEEAEEKLIESNANIYIPSRNVSRDRTPTNKPILQKSFSINSDELPTTPTPRPAAINNNPEPKGVRKSTKANAAPTPLITMSEPSPTKLTSISITSNQSDTNSNFSQPNSEYGSPMAYPSSLVGSTEVTPLSNRKETDYLNTNRSRRSMTRDDERFYSFDSDEENSYYSMSSTSSRYVVEL